jgi:hypothetical protein
MVLDTETQTKTKEQVVDELFTAWEQKFREGRSQINQGVQTQADAIRQLAVNLNEQAGMDKQVIARLIVRRFQDDGIQIAARYVYRTLPPEYKDPELSRITSQMNKQRTEDGYDSRLHKKVYPKNYNIEMLKADQYAYRTVKNIAIHLHAEFVRLIGTDASKESASFKKENESLKKENETLRAENKTLRDLYKELKA